MPKTCETCRWWVRGQAYTIARYGHTPERVGWSAAQTAEYLHQAGECRIAAPHKSGGYFPVTYEFQGCGEHLPREEEVKPCDACKKAPATTRYDGDHLCCRCAQYAMYRDLEEGDFEPGFGED